MKKNAFLCLLAALLCGCSVLSTTADTSVRDSAAHPLGGYKYFHVFSGRSIVESTSTSQSGSGSVSSSHSISTDDPGEYVTGFLMKKGYIRIPMSDSYPEGTLLVTCAKSGTRGWKTEATVQFMDAQTRELLLTVSDKAVGTSKAIYKCLKKVFDGKAMDSVKNRTFENIY